MTAQQKKEYIITETKIRQITDYAINPYYLEDHPELWDEVRNRPHTPTPEPSVDCFWKCEHGKRLQDEAARTATLATLKTFVSRCEDVSTTGQNEYKLMGWVPIEAIKSIAETLQKQIG
jgi:hypothetical protein